MLFPKNVSALLSLAALSSSALAKPHKRACKAHSSLPATTPSAALEAPDYGLSPTAISTCGPSVITITTTDIVTVTITATGAPETTAANLPEASPAISSSSTTPSYDTPVYDTTGVSGSSSQPAVPSASALPSTPAVPSPIATPSTSIPSPPATSSSSVSPNVGANSGKATFYGGNTVGGACSFKQYEIPTGMSGTAFSGAAWDNGVHCGSCLSVKGPKGNVRVMVTDKCPECEATHLDLYQDAFGSIGNPTDGIIPITYDVIPCGITSPLIVRTKSGCSKYWFSMQVVNSNIAVSKLEVSTDGGNTWQATTRKEYNYFEKSEGFGVDSVDVRITAVDGRSIVVKGASVASESSTTADGNFV